MGKYKEKREDIKEKIGYTIVGHSSLIPEFSIALKGKGIKKIAELIENDEDMVHITLYAGTRASEIDISRWEE